MSKTVAACFLVREIEGAGENSHEISEFFLVRVSRSLKNRQNLGLGLGEKECSRTPGHYSILATEAFAPTRRLIAKLDFQAHGSMLPEVLRDAVSPRWCNLYQVLCLVCLLYTSPSPRDS